MKNSISIPRPKRWDRPFGSNMTEEDVDRILTIPPFNRMDPGSYPPDVSLRGIIRNETRIRRYRNGDIVVREGDYENSAFFIISGAVRVVLQSLPNTVLGRQEPTRKGFFEGLAQLWKNSKLPEVRDHLLYKADSSVQNRYDQWGNTQIFLQDLSTIIRNHKTARMEAGEFFGELSALGRTARTATVVADGEAELLEIRWQGLRQIRLRSKEMKEHIDALYRERSLKVHLRETPMFCHLNDEQLAKVADQTQFEAYGNFDWYGPYKSVAGRSPSERLEHEPIIVEEDHYPNGLILIRSGFARMSKRFGHGHRTLSYLGRGRTFGFEEIVHNWQNNSQISLQHTLRAIGYVDILFVPTRIVEELVLPFIPLEHLPQRVSQAGPPMSVQQKREEEKEIEPDLLEFLVEERLINGTSAMVINLDRCTRCDDCVRACAATHENNPRFVRHGKQLGQYMVANACMHCVDPVCMIGCPTGAIHRHSLEGQIIINDLTCIGCSTCAHSCPYDNIRMVSVRNKEGAFILGQDSQTPIMKATKCDLCVGQLGGPACQRACPHDALRRVDMQNVPSLVDLFNR